MSSTIFCASSTFSLYPEIILLVFPACGIKKKSSSGNKSTISSIVNFLFLSSRPLEVYFY